MPIQKSSHYECLKIAERATAQDIHAAWKAAVDQQQRAAGRSPIARAMALADLQAAYEVLSDPRRRAEYDQQLAARRPARPDRPDQVVDGAGPHSANDEHAQAPRTGRAAPAWRRAQERLRGVWWPALHARQGRWAAAVAGTVAVAWWAGVTAGRAPGEGAVPRAVVVREGKRPQPARVLPPAAAEAHGHWLQVAGRAVPHPLDGDPLRLRR
jgi:hypothetical protein